MFKPVVGASLAAGHFSWANDEEYNGNWPVSQ